MESSPALLLQAKNLTKSYDGRAVLRDVSFSLKAGERLALTGPSGSGKTTLLNCLGGVDRTDSGTLLLDGVPLETMNGNALAKLRRQSLGTIFQFFHLLPTLTARENIEFPLQLNGVPSNERRQRVQHLLDRVGISHRAEALPSQLSGGEMQRVAIARALANQPRLLLADEPTGNLDTANGENILALLKELSVEQGAALVLVTHSPEATLICDRVLHMRDGQIFSETTP
jgi:ABC-type lipoprotein export system ATPase subunit